MASPMIPRPSLVDRLARPFSRFFELEVSSALLLLGAATVALIWANSPWSSSYTALFHTPIAFTIGDVFHIELPLALWVNDALMTIFFFVVGMEIKRELVLGELATRERAMLPLLAALGGMIVPAAIYASFHWGQPTLRGWGVPMATDIAFAVAALSVLGSRAPAGLRIFLLALAIADDLGAVAVIAVFYTAEIHLSGLVLAGAGLLACVLLNRAGVRSYAMYVVVGGFVWYQTHHSGVHATISGVLLGFLTPTRAFWVDHETLLARGRSALDRLRAIVTDARDVDELDRGGHQRSDAAQQLAEVGRQTLSPLDFLVNLLERPVAFFIMPLFALSNAGVALDASTLSNPTAQQVGFAVAIGLLVGKPIGITLFSWLSVRLGIAALPHGVDMRALAGAGMLAGIGFTVALFVTALAFTDPVATAGSKIGILTGSVLATLLGLAVLSRTLPKPRDDD